MPNEKPKLFRFIDHFSRHKFATISCILALAILLNACALPNTAAIVAVTPLPAVPPLPATTPVSLSGTPPQTTRSATPTPQNVSLPAGSAAAIALATDVVLKPEVENPIDFDERPVPITFDEFYAGFDMRSGLTLSDKLLSLDGAEVVMEGYMAPPLKPALDWFVLTRIRLAFCPFCSSDADWPTDIAVVYLEDGSIPATLVPVRIEGRMEIGSAVDPETGMVSLVRIYARKIDSIRS